MTEKEILNNFLDSYLTPAFGSLSKTEIDVLALYLLEKTGRITKDDDQYTLSTKLKISQAKVKNLLYNRDLRRYKDKETEMEMEKKTIDLLLNARYDKRNDGYFLIEIEDKLLLEYIKNKIRKLGYISDGSFSPSLIKLKAEAFAAIIESCIKDEGKDEILKELKEIDPSNEDSFKNILIDSLKMFAKKYVGDESVDLTVRVFNIMKEKLKQ